MIDGALGLINVDGQGYGARWNRPQRPRDAGPQSADRDHVRRLDEVGRPVRESDNDVFGSGHRINRHKRFADRSIVEIKTADIEDLKR